MNWTQQDAPLMDALKEHLMNRVVRFDVPGHKGGRGNHELADFLGQRCVQIDVNSMKNLDNLCHPVSVLRDAQQLAAEAFGAANAFFIINGATGASQAMIMSVCKAGEKLIMPRNVHRSAINALVVNGAIPVYVDPDENKDLGIPLGMSVEAVERAILANPDAKAVLVNNPTYYGVCPDIRRIAKLAHEHGMLLLADEAHGTHFYFGENLPCSAMAAGADMASVSIHKTGGSLTQSAMLLCAEGINADYVRQVINLTQTTSASYLLMVSLDIARRNLAMNGREMYRKAVQYVDYAREEINRIGGYYVYGDELCNGDSFYAFDRTGVRLAPGRIRHSDRVRRHRQYPCHCHCRRSGVGDRTADLGVVGDQAAVRRRPYRHAAKRISGSGRGTPPAAGVLCGQKGCAAGTERRRNLQ